MRVYQHAIAVSFACVLMLYSPANAEEPAFELLRDRVKSEAFSLGALIQVVGNYSTGDRQTINDGFALANLRLIVQGDLDRGVGYLVRTSFIKSPALLDAAISVTASRYLKLTGGAFKAPFSAEFIESAAAIDFVNRSQAVTLLVPGRQIGLQASGDVAKQLRYKVGVFNGNGLQIENDDDDVMGVARLEFEHQRSDEARLSVGLHGFVSRDTNAPIGVPITGDFIAEGFGGKRRAIGADARAVHGVWMVNGEVVWSRFDPTGGSRVEPWGWQASIGRFVRDDVQLLARWDSVRPDGALANSDLLILGTNWWPSSPTELQVNLVIPTNGDGGVQVLVNAQVAF